MYIRWRHTTPGMRRLPDCTVRATAELLGVTYQESAEILGVSEDQLLPDGAVDVRTFRSPTLFDIKAAVGKYGRLIEDLPYQRRPSDRKPGIEEFVDGYLVPKLERDGMENLPAMLCLSDGRMAHAVCVRNGTAIDSATRDWFKRFWVQTYFIFEPKV